MPLKVMFRTSRGDEVVGRTWLPDRFPANANGSLFAGSFSKDVARWASTMQARGSRVGSRSAIRIQKVHPGSNKGRRTNVPLRTRLLGSAAGSAVVNGEAAVGR